MKNLMIFIISLFSFSLFASELNLLSGKVGYFAKFPLKNIKGSSKDIKGKGECDKNTCNILFAAKVTSFISGDGNRDSHMYEVTKASLFPIVSVKGKFNRPKVNEKFLADLVVHFAGKVHKINEVQIGSINSNGQIDLLKGNFVIKLSDFQIERPSLLTVEIDDEVVIDFELKVDEK